MIQIDSIEETSEQIVQDIESKTNQTTPAVPFAYNKNLSDSMAAQVAVTKLHNVDQRKECFVKTASEFVGLPLLAAETNTPRENGEQTILIVDVTGVESTVIGTYSSGPEFVANDVVYQTISGGTITSGTAQINIKAKVSGTAGNLQDGAEVTLSSTYPNIDDTGIVDSTLSSGSDKEAVEAWRQRIAQEQAFPSTVAGTTPWFARISREVPGITAAYPYSSDTLGEVDIYLSADSETGGVPTEGQLRAVIDIFQLAPNDCLYSTSSTRTNAIASTKEEYTVAITQTSSITSATRATIITEIEKYFENRKPFIEGVSLQNTEVINKADLIAVTQNVIASVTGETGIVTDVVITSISLPTAADTYVMPKGFRAFVSSITFV